MRTEYRDAYFAYGSDDGLSIEAWYGPGIQAAQAITVGIAAPAPAMVLNGGQRMYLPLVVEP